MNDSKFNFFTFDELNQKENVNGVVDCHISDNVSFQMFCANNDCAVARRFFWNNCYEKKTLELWNELSQKINDSLILDIGAHTGVYSLCASVANKKNTILSFEPFFMNYARMSSNFKLNNINPKNLFLNAVGNSNQIVKLKINTDIHYLSSGGSILGDKGFELPVQEISIDNFIKNKDKSKVAMIKIDVEGYEPNVLKGMNETISTSYPIIFFESNKPNIPESFHQILSKDYLFFEIDDKKQKVTEVLKLEVSDNYFLHNRVAVPKKSNLLKIFK
jgi:FkbM family methyltransferase